MCFQETQNWNHGQIEAEIPLNDTALDTMASTAESKESHGKNYSRTEFIYRRNRGMFHN